MLSTQQAADAAAKAADQAAQAQVTPAQAANDQAQARASQLAGQLMSDQNQLEFLEEHRPSGINALVIWLQEKAALQTAIANLQPQVAGAQQAAAATAATLAARRNAQQMTAAQVVALDQQVANAQAELDAANAALAAAHALVDELRANAPPVSEALRASNVVDGLALRKRWRAGISSGLWDDTSIPFGKGGLPVLDTPEGMAVAAELHQLDDAVDALADVLVAESVHHTVQGNAQRAGATVDALSRGDGAPAEIEVVRTPRAGTAVTQRLLVLADAAASSGWPTDSDQVRAKVEPALEAWAAGVLGPANRVRLRYRKGATISTSDLSVLKLSALDALAMTPAGGPAGATELELRAARLPRRRLADPRPRLVMDRHAARPRRVPRARPRHA